MTLLLLMSEVASVCSWLSDVAIACCGGGGASGMGAAAILRSAACIAARKHPALTNSAATYCTASVTKSVTNLRLKVICSARRSFCSSASVQAALPMNTVDTLLATFSDARP